MLSVCVSWYTYVPCMEEVWVQLCGVGSLLPPRCGFRGSGSSQQVLLCLLSHLADHFQAVLSDDFRQWQLVPDLPLALYSNAALDAVSPLDDLKLRLSHSSVPPCSQLLGRNGEYTGEESAWLHSNILHSRRHTALCQGEAPWDKVFSVHCHPVANKIGLSTEPWRAETAG